VTTPRRPTLLEEWLSPFGVFGALFLLWLFGASFVPDESEWWPLVGGIGGVVSLLFMAGIVQEIHAKRGPW